MVEEKSKKKCSLFGMTFIDYMFYSRNGYPCDCEECKKKNLKFKKDFF